LFLNLHESRNNLLSNARAVFNPLFQKMNIFQTTLETEHGIFFANVQHENKKVLDIKLHPVIGGAIFPPLLTEMCMLGEFVARVEKMLDSLDLA